MFHSFSLYDIFWYFFIYSFLGWCIEVVFCSANTGHFINRGFLNGPLCPIYGFGGVLVVLLLHPLQSLLALFIISAALCSLLELAAGFILKKLFHTTWWDYSERPLNLGGYICLKFSLMWGVACVLLLRVIHPLVYRFVQFLPHILGMILLGFFGILFILDVFLTVLAITQFNRDLREITRLAQELHKGSDILAKNLGNTAIVVADKIEALDLETRTEHVRQKVSEERQKLHYAVRQKRSQLSTQASQKGHAIGSELEENLAAIKTRLHQLLAKRHFTRERLLRAFPKMKSWRYADAFDRWRAHRTNHHQDEDISK